MDETSIITQVHKEQCPPVNSNGNHVPEEKNDQQHITPPSSSLPATTTSSKKRRQRGFLSSIFCCFGAQTSAKASFQNNSATTGQQHGSPASPHHQQDPHTPNSCNNTTTTASVIHQASPNNNQHQQGALTKCYTDDDNNDRDNAQDEVVNEQSSQESFYLLPALRHQDLDKKCAVIDLDETLVHSSFKPVDNPDFIVPVEIDGIVHQVYVLKRPHVDEFLRRMGEIFECILFTASLAKYADPVADLLDETSCFRTRLFRESCVYYKGNYVKDLSKLGRDLHNVIIIDNSPASYIFHPENAVPVMSWFDDRNDTELREMIPFLENLSSADSCINALQNNYNRYREGLAMSRHQQQHQQHNTYTNGQS